MPELLGNPLLPVLRIEFEPAMVMEFTSGQKRYRRARFEGSFDP